MDKDFDKKAQIDERFVPLEQYTGEIHDRLEFLYAQHLTLFIHSDNFVQQRTTQFNTINTVFFAIYGLFLGYFFSVPDDDVRSKVLVIIMSAVIAILGVLLSYVWLCSYKRSVLYREVHRDTLKVLDLHLQEADRATDYQRRIELLGPFTVRDMVLYKDRCLKYGSGGKELKVGSLSKKKKFSNVESIPQFTIFLWALFLVASINFLLGIFSPSDLQNLGT